MSIPAIWFLVCMVGGFCGIASGVSRVKRYADGTFYFACGAINFMIAGSQLAKLM